MVHPSEMEYAIFFKLFLLDDRMHFCTSQDLVGAL